MNGPNKQLYFTRLERLSNDEHSSLLVAFISYEENDVLWIQPLGLYSRHFIFFLTYEWAQYARVFHTLG
jgi:hypothetical protein